MRDADDRAWALIAEQWRSTPGETSPAAEVRARAQARLRRVSLLEIIALVVGLALPLALYDALRHHPEIGWDHVVPAVAVHVVVIWILLVVNRRTAHRHVGASAVEFLQAGIARARRQLTSIAVLATVLLLECVLFAFYVARVTRERSVPGHMFAVGAGPELAATVAFLLAVAGGLLWAWISVRRQLRRLISQLAALQGPDEVPM